ncbi:unnamed protein product [Closterium sp. NIES-65]|nr:unnamed protein product [Closterium sp. NIES-65]
MGMPHSLCLSLCCALGGQEDAVLLRHALQKFTDRFCQNFLRKHLGAAALSQHNLLDGHNQPLLCQDRKQQQSEHSEGVGAAALAFGGLSYEECVTAFLAPHARCCLPPAPPNLSSLVATPPLAFQGPPPASQAPPPASQAPPPASQAPPPASQAPPPASQAPPPASQAAPFSAAVASTTECPFARHAVPVAAASTAAALRCPAKRPRGDSPGLTAGQPVSGGNESWVVRGGVAFGTERRRQSVAEQFKQQGASSRVQETEEAALLEALLQEEHRQQQQGGAGSRAQRRVDWPPVGSESALPDDVLLGLSCEDPAFMQGTAFSAPLPTQPLTALPLAMLPKLAALSGSAPCIGDGSTLQRVEWPRVGSESALPDDVLLGLCCEGPASAQRAALSAPPPTQPCAPVALCASAPGSTSSCIAVVLAGSTCGT